MIARWDSGAHVLAAEVDKRERLRVARAESGPDPQRSIPVAFSLPAIGNPPAYRYRASSFYDANHNGMRDDGDVDEAGPFTHTPGPGPGAACPTPTLTPPPQRRPLRCLRGCRSVPPEDAASKPGGRAVLPIAVGGFMAVSAATLVGATWRRGRVPGG